MAARALPARAPASTVLPSSARVLGQISPPIGIITGNPSTGGAVGAFRNAPAPVRALLGGPLGLLLGADLDLGELALRIGALVVGVALIIAGGFLVVKEAEGSALGRGIAAAAATAKGAA